MDGHHDNDQASARQRPIKDGAVATTDTKRVGFIAWQFIKEKDGEHPTNKKME